MADLSFPYPDILSKTAWDKNKGIVVKLSTKTDVGPMLAAIEAEVKKSFQSVKGFAGTDVVDFLSYKENLAKELAQAAKTISGKAANANVVLKAAHADFQQSKTIPKSSTAYVKKIMDAIKPFQSAVAEFPAKALTEIHNDYKKRVSALSAYAALKDAAGSLDGTYAKLMGMIKKVESAPTIENFQSLFKGDGPHRQMTTVCKLWDQMVPKNFPKLVAKIYAGKAMADFAGLPCMMDAANETNEVATKKIRKAIEGGQPEARAVTTYLLQYSSSVIGSAPIIKHIKAAWKELSAI